MRPAGGGGGLIGSGEAVLAQVAAAVDLDEGEAGVREVIRTIARLEPVAVRELGRSTSLPVPVVAAVCNELRRHGLVSEQRPVRLTAEARRALPKLTARIDLDAVCVACAQGVVVPAALESLRAELEGVAADAPAVDVTIDQSHATVETKLRRAALLLANGSVAGRRVLFLGDDDLGSVALDRTLRRLGAADALEELAVTDLDERVLDFVAARLEGAPYATAFVRHDLREPLPPTLAGRFDTVFTDPPYTAEGGRLFLTRAVEATAGRGSHVYLAFGAPRPEQSVAVQAAIAELGLVLRDFHRNLNEYVGAGILGGTSHLYRLETTAATPRAAEPYAGPLYTGDRERPARPYRCAACGHVVDVGPGEAFATVEALREAGCASCGGRSFEPGPRRRR